MLPALGHAQAAPLPLLLWDMPVITGPEPNPNGGVVRLTLWQRQLAFLRQHWWRTEPLSLWERLMVIARGLFLMAVACIGAIVAFNSILNSPAIGMDALGKLVAEFMLLPIALLALIMVAFGGSLIVRAVVSPWPDPNALPITSWEHENEPDAESDVR